jgi:hypothetical protein
MKISNQLPGQPSTVALLKHFSDTYFSLRVGLALLSFAFPLVLYGYGKWRYGIGLQPSMSAYFFAATAEHCATFPMRTLFVGFLCAIAVGLYAYKGFTALENLLLNGAGFCAVLVAAFPERLTVPEGASNPVLQQLFSDCPAVRRFAETPPSWPIHYIAAVVLFVLLAAVVWFCADKTLAYLTPGKGDAARFRRRYKTLAVLMLAFPLTGLVLALLLNHASTWVFFVEAAGVWTFSAYWAVKSRELALSQIEHPAAMATQSAAS